MKKLILTIAVATFTLGAFAGETCCPVEQAAAKAAKKSKTVATTACSTATTTACADKAATAGCPMAKAKCAHVAAKKIQSPKAASQS
jgi:hypothetical protein